MLQTVFVIIFVQQELYQGLAAEQCMSGACVHVVQPLDIQ